MGRGAVVSEVARRLIKRGHDRQCRSLSFHWGVEKICERDMRLKNKITHSNNRKTEAQRRGARNLRARHALEKQSPLPPRAVLRARRVFLHAVLQPSELVFRVRGGRRLIAYATRGHALIRLRPGRQTAMEMAAALAQLDPHPTGAARHLKSGMGHDLRP